jgi:hypothetical protein
MDPLSATVPDVKDIVSRIQFSMRPDTKQADNVFSYLASGGVGFISANEGVVAIVQQYEAVKDILALADLQVAHVAQARDSESERIGSPNK